MSKPCAASRLTNGANRESCSPRSRPLTNPGPGRFRSVKWPVCPNPRGRPTGQRRGLAASENLDERRRQGQGMRPTIFRHEDANNALFEVDCRPTARPAAHPTGPKRQGEKEERAPVDVRPELPFPTAPAGLRDLRVLVDVPVAESPNLRPPRLAKGSSLAAIAALNAGTCASATVMTGNWPRGIEDERPAAIAGDAKSEALNLLVR